MKKLFVMIFALVSTGLYFNASAQCTPPNPTGTGGFSPHWQCAPCVEQTVGYTAVLNIEIPDSIAGQPLAQVTLDTIKDLPIGLSYTIHPGKTIPGGSTACLDITGTTTDTVGKYKIGIYVSLNAGGIPINNQNLGDIIHLLGSLGQLPAGFDTTSFDYYVRVIAQGGTCDTTQCFADGVNSLSDRFSSLSAQPNPFNSKTEISWSSTINGTFTAKMYDVAGKEVLNKQIHVSMGTNKMTIEKGDLAKGSYIFVITDGRKSVSTKLIVRD